jgi:chaperonin GroES
MEALIVRAAGQGTFPPASQNQNNTPMKFRPLHDRVVVKRIEADEKTAGGIIIPDTAKEKPQQGEVIAVGPGGRDETGKLIPIDVQAGDRVGRRQHDSTSAKATGDNIAAKLAHPLADPNGLAS